MELDIQEVYKNATGQSLREQDRRLVYEFAAQMLYEYAAAIKQTVNHSDVDNHDFEDGKEAVANHMLKISADLK